MPLMFSDQDHLYLESLANETIVSAIASNGTKTLHLLTRLYYDESTGCYTPCVRFTVADRKTQRWYRFDSVEMAIEKYNEL